MATRAVDEIEELVDVIRKTLAGIVTEARRMQQCSKRETSDAQS